MSRACKDQAAVAALADGTLNLYLCAVDGDAARAPHLPVRAEGEDPATGSAAGPLLAYANARLGTERLESRRASRWAARACCWRRWRTGARVGGDVVVLVTGTLRLP